MRKCTFLAAKVSFAVLLTLFIEVASLAQSVGDVSGKLEHQVVEHRKQVRSIDAEIMSAVTFADGRSRKRAIAYEYSNGKKRCNVISSANADPDPSGNQSAVLTIATGDFFLYYDNAIDGDDALTVADLRQPESAEARLFEEPDLKFVGLLPDTFANLDSYADRKILRSPSFQASGVEEQDRQLDFSCTRVDYIHKENPQVKVSVWYRESWEYEVAKVMMSFGAIVETVTTEAKHFDNYGWFPTTVLYRRENGGRIEKEERLEIKVNSLNTPIDPERFTLATAGLPEGYPVSDFTVSPARQRQWSAQGLKDKRNPPFPEVPIGDAGNSSPKRFYLLIANAIVVGSLGIWILRRRRNTY